MTINNSFLSLTNELIPDIAFIIIIIVTSRVVSIIFGEQPYYVHFLLLLAEETCPEENGSTKSSDSRTTAAYSTKYTSITLIGVTIVTVFAVVLGTVYVFWSKKEGRDIDLELHNYKLQDVATYIIFDSGIS